jgi:hypothetical protein
MNSFGCTYTIVTALAEDEARLSEGQVLLEDQQFPKERII